MKVARTEIILAARELFREKGYAGASMQDLADRVGLKKASLYMRFPSKEALVPEVLELTLRDSVSLVREGDPWDIAYERLVRGMAAELSGRRRCVGLHLAYGIGDDTPDAKRAVGTFFRALAGSMSAILAQAMPRPIADDLAADALIRVEGATLLTAVFDDAAPMERTVRVVLADAAAAAARANARIGG